MNRIIVILILLFILSILPVIILIKGKKLSKPESKVNTQEQISESLNTNMKLTSTAFENNGKIPSRYTCDGQNFNPPFGISEIPENVKSMALIVDDPDVPSGTWVHWTLWNINVDTKEIPENTVPAGAIEGVTSFGKNGYGGPCPPTGTHRYFFKLYALDAELSLPSSAKVSDLEEVMKGHIIDQTQLVGLYSR